MKCITAYITHPGGREINEDSYGVFENNGKYFFIVADGLGGHGFGEVASKAATDIAENAASQSAILDGKNLIENIINDAQKSILELQIQKHNKQGMKTTIVCLCIDDNNIVWGHIGDSRLYAFKKRKLKTRTLDHSVPQMLVVAKEIKEKQIRKHPDRNKLLRVVGIPWDRPQYEISPQYSINDFDAFLLCSDGFWELIDEKTMQKLLKKAESPQTWIEAMTQEVIKNGKNDEMDNYTAIAVWIEK